MNESEPQASVRRVDPRPEQTRELVLQAARLIISSGGQSEVTPTRLVEVSGVARSTIYRHWPDADSIVRDALDMDTIQSELYSSGDPAADLRNYLQELRAVLESPGAAIIMSQAERAERDEHAHNTLVGNAQQRRKIIREFLRDPRKDFGPVHAQIVGPMFMQRYFMREPITDEFIDHIVTTYLTTAPT